jgi:hypothetical protein
VAGGVYCRGVRYFEFEDKTQNKCTLMNTPPTEVIPLTEMQEKMGWFGGGTYGGCDAEEAEGLSSESTRGSWSHLDLVWNDS